MDRPRARITPGRAAPRDRGRLRAADQALRQSQRRAGLESGRRSLHRGRPLRPAEQARRVRLRARGDP